MIPLTSRPYQLTGKLVFTGKSMAPESDERPTHKHTIKSYPGYVTRMVMRFELPSGA
jgi:spore coat protein A, manganese oxidase